jgi:8-oxo-dGTP pyrophosphatase MutT (NUDIX family)
MYFNSRMVQDVADKYGYPPIINMPAPVSSEEYNFIRSTQSYGRCHDFTLYIFKGNKVIVNAKHHYPIGLYRAPSGGLKPGEKFHEGVAREAYEETGSKIELLRYILQVNASFSCGTKVIPWKTHVFTAKYISGKIAPVDIREIREARLAGLAEFDEYRKIISGMESGGLSYRACLHDEVLKFL